MYVYIYIYCNPKLASSRGIILNLLTKLVHKKLYKSYVLVYTLFLQPLELYQFRNHYGRSSTAPATNC